MSQIIQAKILKFSSRSARIREFRLAEESGNPLPNFAPVPISACRCLIMITGVTP